MMYSRVRGFKEDSTLNRQFEDFAGFYGFKPILCRPYRGQTKGKVERTVRDEAVFLHPSQVDLVDDVLPRKGVQPLFLQPFKGDLVGGGVYPKGKVERTVQFVRDNFMVGIKYNSLADLNGQALAWCNKDGFKGKSITLPCSNRTFSASIVCFSVSLL